jgi:hypothetical protein
VWSDRAAVPDKFNVRHAVDFAQQAFDARSSIVGIGLGLVMVINGTWLFVVEARSARELDIEDPC